MSTLNRKFNEDLVITKKRLDETKALVDKEIAGMVVVKHLQRPWFTLERRMNGCKLPLQNTLILYQKGTKH